MKLEELEGVGACVVSLEEDKAEVEYSPGIISSQDIIDTINNIGDKFLASIKETE